MTLFVVLCALSIATFASLAPLKAKFRCLALYTVYTVNRYGNVIDRTTWHGSGNSCAEAMAEAKWRASSDDIVKPVEDPNNGEILFTGRGSGLQQ